MNAGRAVAVVIALGALGCAAGTPASSPEAFQIAAGTPVTLHMRNGKTISGELAGDDARSVSLDSGRIVVSKADIDTVETLGSYEAKPMHATDEFGHPASRPTEGNACARSLSTDPGWLLWWLPVVVCAADH